MHEYLAKCGLIKGMTTAEYYSDGTLKHCKVNEENQIKTSVGLLIPKYDNYETRSKFRNSLEFHKNGELKSIYLEEQKEINSPIGKLKAEMITFYDEGNVHRIFPLYGQISGYWSEEDEYSMAENTKLNLKSVQLDAKISCFCFYPSGKIKSITFWRNERQIVEISYGKIKVHLGISFYEDGNIKTLEPYIPFKISTAIGECLAFDNNPIGIHGDNNSLHFNNDGSIRSLITSINGLKIKGEGNTIEIAPALVPSRVDIDTMEIIPIKIEFEDKKVIITDSYNKTFLFPLDKYNFAFFMPKYDASLTCSGNCSNCRLGY